MKHRIFALVLALVMVLGVVPARAAEAEPVLTGYAVPAKTATVRQSSTKVPTEAEAYAKIIAMKEQYPERMPWTNDDYYAWKGGIFSGGFGCAGFAFILSDAAFGDLPARKLTSFAYSDLRVGDILRINSNTHSVVVLEIHDSYVVIAEGNYNSSIHWGRTLTKEKVLQSDYVLTRYPDTHTHSYADQVVNPTCTKQGYTIHTCTICGDSYTSTYTTALGHSWDAGQVTTPATSTQEGVKTYTCTVCGATKTESIPATGGTPFVDVEPDQFYYDPVLWAVENGITTGMDATHFSPNAYCTRGQVVTFLWRAEGCPEPTTTNCPFVDVSPDRFDYKAILWAAENGITTGMDSTHFEPEQNVTRGQFVTFLWRTQGMPDAGTSNPFTDVASDAYYTDAVLWAVENGITEGTNDAGTTFSPDKDCTRAQNVTFLYRHYGKD